MNNSTTATVIFDNAGSITVQLTQGYVTWAHYYSEDIQAAASDTHAALAGADIDTYDGNEEDAAECSPTYDEIRNGGYRVYKFSSLAELEDFALAKHDNSWANVKSFAYYVMAPK